MTSTETGGTALRTFAHRRAVGPQPVASIATAAFGVIGSVVGAYFGVKVGAEGTAKALDAHRAEAARAQRVCSASA
jgi:hypothetical protein